MRKEIFYVLEGDGAILVDGERRGIRKGTCIKVDKGKKHQIVNTSKGKLKVLSVVSPPFSRDGFLSDHQDGQ